MGDALSRHKEGALLAITQPVLQWIEPLHAEGNHDEVLQGLVKRIQEDEAVGQWFYQSGLFFKDRISVKATSPIAHAILE